MSCSWYYWKCVETLIMKNNDRRRFFSETFIMLKKCHFIRLLRAVFVVIFVVVVLIRNDYCILSKAFPAFFMNADLHSGNKLIMRVYMCMSTCCMFLIHSECLSFSDIHQFITSVHSFVNYFSTFFSYL